jgi:hypothetical protein
MMNPVLETPAGNQALGKEKDNQDETKEATRLNPKRTHLDYPNPLKDDLWRAEEWLSFSLTCKNPQLSMNHKVQYYLPMVFMSGRWI